MTHDNHKGFYTRGYLPDIDDPELPQMITYRLADALPTNVRQRLANSPDDTRGSATEQALDRGYGACWLRRDKAAEIVAENFQFHDGKKYRLRDWVVMPNHVHVSYDNPTKKLDGIVRDWKSYTSSKIKPVVGLSRDERVWQRGYFDRYIRDKRHFFNVRCYIILNPVKAGLVDDPFDWPYSSIHDYEHLKDSFRRWFRRWKKRFWGSYR